MVDERIAARRAALRAEARRRRLRRSFVIMAFIVVVVAMLSIDRAGGFDIVAIEVVGTDRLDSDRVRAVADVETGASIVWLRTGTVEYRVASLPLVRTAEVTRTMRRTVEVRVTERVPVVQVRGRGDDVVVDRDGVIIDVVGADDAALPVIDVRGTVPASGDTVDAHRGVANAFDVWRGLSGPLRAEVLAVRVDGPEDATAVLRRGIDVRIGRADRMPEKVRAIGAVLADIGEVPVAQIDVRAPAAPVVIPTGE
ncbi:MAG: FtsQ-type POTRA domain-containing protein [Nitriliruptoraceae bacterium]